MRARRWVIAALVALAAVLLVGRGVAGAYVDYRWYAAMDAVAVWRAKASYIAVLKLTSGLVASAFIFVNLYAVRHSVVSLVLPRRVANIEIGEEVPGRYLVGAAGALSLLLGTLLSLPAASWTAFALIDVGVPFGEREPYLEADLSFFVYRLPFETTVWMWAIIAVLLVTAVVVFFYALTPSLRWDRGALYVSNYVRRHLIALGALLLLLLAWSYRLDAYKTVLDGSGVDGAFTFADHRARIPVNMWLSFLTMGAALVVLWFGWQGQVRVAFAAVTVVLVLSLTARQLAPLLVRRFGSTVDAATREMSYLATRADYTRRAYALDRIGPPTATAVFADPGEALGGVSLWDAPALARAVAGAERLSVTGVRVGWAPSPAGLLATVPLRPAPVPGTAARAAQWSVARVLAGTADARGSPIMVSRTGTPTAETDVIGRVVVEDSAYGYLIVPDSLGRIAAPELTSIVARLAHAWSFQNVRLLFGDLPGPRPHVVTRRGVRDRVGALAPFFAQGTAILPILSADSLWWTVDLYSASTSYPLSQRVSAGESEYSYFQHAATAFVNAHSGRVVLAADSARDPIAKSWMRAFPRVFTRWLSIPAALAAAAPPPIDAAGAQASVVARVGLRADAHGGGTLPPSDGADTSLVEGPPPIVALPGSRGALAVTLPVLDEADHLLGLVVATGGPTASAHWLPASNVTMRWDRTIEALRRAADSLLTLPREARAVRGKLRVLPIAGEVAMAQPTYAWPPDGAPTLVRVAASLGERVRSGRTFAEAIGVRAASEDDTAPLSPSDFRSRVQTLYEQMRSALRSGDWVAFGRAYEALGALLARPPR